MVGNSRLYHRRSIRLRGYDYSGAGVYFITICTQNRVCLFGDIREGLVCLNPVGRVVKQCWDAIPDHFPWVALDSYVVMPNHLHGILWVAKRDPIVARLPPYQPTQETRVWGTSRTLGSVIRGFKAGVFKWMQENQPGVQLWQRNYYERIIRGDESLRRIRKYIHDNPAQWAFTGPNFP